MIGREQKRAKKKKRSREGCSEMIYAPVSSEALTALTSLRKHYPGEHARRDVPGPCSLSTYNTTVSRDTHHTKMYTEFQVPCSHTAICI